jgi:hypothetical protein
MRACFKFSDEWNNRAATPRIADISTVEMSFEYFVEDLFNDRSAASDITYGEHNDIPGCYSVFVNHPGLADLGMSTLRFIGVVMLETSSYFNYFVLIQSIYSRLPTVHNKIPRKFFVFADTFQIVAPSKMSSMTFTNTIL